MPRPALKRPRWRYPFFASILPAIPLLALSAALLFAVPFVIPWRLPALIVGLLILTARLFITLVPAVAIASRLYQALGDRLNARGSG